MKALVYKGAETLQFEDCREPTESTEEVLVHIKAVNICGSDMHAYFGHDERRPPPLILGHEAAGVIADGADKGKPVVINPLVACGKCKMCLSGRDNLCFERQIISMPPRQGAFCEYIRMPRRNLIAVPQGFSLEKASLTEPIACGRQAVRLAEKAYNNIDRGDYSSARALIFGGGAIGLAVAVNLQAFGNSDISVLEPNPVRRDFIKSHYDFTLLSEVPEDIAPEQQYDLVFDAYGGGASRESACRAVRPGGVILHTGLADSKEGFDARRATLQEITFIGTYTYTMEVFEETAKAIFDGDLGELAWQETRPLSDGAVAFRDLAAQKIAVPKIMLVP